MRAAPTPLEAKEATDAELLASVADGNLGSLGKLYDRHARDVWRVVRRVTRGADDVEDVVHATFLKLPQLAASFDGRASCRNWLCGIGVRLALRRGRTLHRFTQMLARYAAARHEPAVVDPETHASRRQEMAVFERALRALPDKKRAVFVLIELEGLGHGDVAEALEIPVATVRTRLWSAKQTLREALRKGGAA